MVPKNILMIQHIGQLGEILLVAQWAIVTQLLKELTFELVWMEIFARESITKLKLVQ